MRWSFWRPRRKTFFSFLKLSEKKQKDEDDELDIMKNFNLDDIEIKFKPGTENYQKQQKVKSQQKQNFKINPSKMSTFQGWLTSFEKAVFLFPNHFCEFENFCF